MDTYIEAAVAQFRELLCQQAARQERMEKNAPAKDFARAEKTVIGVIGGDGIGPIIVAQALRVHRPCRKAFRAFVQAAHG